MNTWMILACVLSITQMRAFECQKSLFRAAQEGDIQTLRSLINSGIPVNSTDTYGSTALHHAVYHGHITCVKELIAQHADVSCTNKVKQMPLHHAVQKRLCTSQAESICTLLLQAGAQITCPDGAGKTPLEYALARGDDHLVQLLLNGSTNTKGYSVILVPATPEQNIEPINSQALSCSASEKPVNHTLLNTYLTKKRVLQAYNNLSQLLPSLPQIARNSFPLFGRHTYADILCILTAWREAAEVLYLKALVLKVVPDLAASKTIEQHARKRCAQILNREEAHELFDTLLEEQSRENLIPIPKSLAHRLQQFFVELDKLGASKQFVDTQ